MRSQWITPLEVSGKLQFNKKCKTSVSVKKVLNSTFLLKNAKKKSEGKNFFQKTFSLKTFFHIYLFEFDL